MKIFKSIVRAAKMLRSRWKRKARKDPQIAMSNRGPQMNRTLLQRAGEIAQYTSENRFLAYLDAKDFPSAWAEWCRYTGAMYVLFELDLISFQYYREAVHGLYDAYTSTAGSAPVDGQRISDAPML